MEVNSTEPSPSVSVPWYIPLVSLGSVCGSQNVESEMSLDQLAQQIPERNRPLVVKVKHATSIKKPPEFNVRFSLFCCATTLSEVDILSLK